MWIFANLRITFVSSSIRHWHYYICVHHIFTDCQNIKQSRTRSMQCTLINSFTPMSVVCGDMTNKYFTTNQKESNQLFVDEATCHVKRGRFFLLFAVTLCSMNCSTVCKRWHASSRVITRPSGSLGCRWPAALKLPLQSRGAEVPEQPPIGGQTEKGRSASKKPSLTS